MHKQILFACANKMLDVSMLKVGAGGAASVTEFDFLWNLRVPWKQEFCIVVITGGLHRVMENS